jgi:hypothetical protein
MNLFPIVLAGFSITFILMGLYLLIWRKLLIVRAFWIALYIPFTLSPAIGKMIQDCFITPVFLDYIFPILWGLIIFWLIRNLTGHFVYGLTNNIDNTLNSFLKKNRHKYDTCPNTITVENLYAEIAFGARTWLGGQRIFARNKQNHEAYDKLIQKFKSEKIKPDILFSMFYSILGLIIGGLTIIFFF